MKNKHIFIGIFVLILVIITIVYFKNNDLSEKKKEPNDLKSEIISRNGLHWHPELLIYVKGEKVDIPANIGLGKVHNPIHTHDEDASLGIIHLEFSEIVRKDDTKLGEFFKVWEKDITSFGSNMKMTVNGVENTEFENYHMKDGDKIELRYY